MKLTLSLAQEEMVRLYRHAEDALPNESVALLFGVVKGDGVVVSQVALLENRLQSKTSFEVNPEEEYRLLVSAEERGESLVCIFHSHPAPPYPSSSDLDNMRLNPVVWLIASKTSGSWESKAYLLEEDQTEVEEVLVTLTT